jgi:hypothetical protein
MPFFDPESQKPLRLHGDAPNASPRAARVSFALAIIALAVGVACMMGEQWRPGLILVLAGVAGTMTSVQAWQVRRSVRLRSTDDDHAA